MVNSGLKGLINIIGYLNRNRSVSIDNNTCIPNYLINMLDDKSYFDIQNVF